MEKGLLELIRVQIRDQHDRAVHAREVFTNASMSIGELLKEVEEKSQPSHWCSFLESIGIDETQARFYIALSQSDGPVLTSFGKS